MAYNIHPIIVHFPIALLFLYSIIKILPLVKWFPTMSWKQIERVLLLVGFLGALAALVTGPLAAELIRPNEALVKAHSTFAFFSAILYGLLLVSEIISFRLAQENFLTAGIFSKLLAFVGLVLISLTGLLGGVMVYGLSADPLAPMVLRLLNINFP